MANMSNPTRIKLIEASDYLLSNYSLSTTHIRSIFLRGVMNATPLLADIASF